MKAILINWMAFFAVLSVVQVSMANGQEELNNFDLRNYGSVDQAIDSLADKDFRVLSEDDDIAYRDFVIEQLLSGEKVPGICGLADTVSCEEQIKMLAGNGRLREMLNRGKGEYIRLRTTPYPGPYQIQNLYSIHTRKKKTGLIFYVAVSGDGYRRAGLPDYVKSTFGWGDDTDHKAVQAGVIYLIKFRL